MNFMMIAIVPLRQHLLGAARWGEDLFYRYTRVLTPVFPLPLPFPRYSLQSNTNTQAQIQIQIQPTISLTVPKYTPSLVHRYHTSSNVKKTHA